jgi:hypothetical protein
MRPHAAVSTVSRLRNARTPNLAAGSRGRNLRDRKDLSMPSSLRLFAGEEDGIYSEPPQVTMTLGEFCRILTDAQRVDSTWLQDFADDDVQIPPDLYEVLTAYRSLQAAA